MQMKLSFPLHTSYRNPGGEEDAFPRLPTVLFVRSHSSWSSLHPFAQWPLLEFPDVPSMNEIYCVASSTFIHLIPWVPLARWYADHI